MPFIQSVLLEALRSAVRIVASMLSATDRRTIVLERRAKALSLFKELAAVGLRPNDLREIEQALTEDEEGRSPLDSEADRATVRSIR